MTSQKLKNLLVVFLILLYSIPIGIGSYLQYTSHQSIQEITQGIDGAISPEKAQELSRYRTQSQQSEQIKKIGRLLGYFIAPLSLVFYFFHKFSFRNFVLSTYGSLLFGALLTLPWWLSSGLHYINFYLEQFVLALYTLPFILVAIFVFLYQKKHPN